MDVLRFNGVWTGYLYKERVSMPYKQIYVYTTQYSDVFSGILYEKTYKLKTSNLVQNEILGMINRNAIRFRQKIHQAEMTHKQTHFIGHFIHQTNKIEGDWRSSAGQTGSFNISPKGLSNLSILKLDR